MIAAVTGASGHLGANLLRILLAKKWKIKALVHVDTRALEGLDIERVDGNVLNEESLIRCFTGADVVFHLAGKISIVYSDRKEVEAVNITGVQNVVNACKKAGVKRLVHTSSFHAHQQEPLDKPLDETRPLFSGTKNPPYNYSKARGEMIIGNAVRDGMDAIIINPGGMLGPNDFKPSHFGETILALATGKLPALVDAGLCWVDIRDVAEGMITACEQAKPGSKYILSGKWVTLSGIAREVSKIIGNQPPQIVLPLWAAKMAAPVATIMDRLRGKRPMFTSIAMKELESNPDISFKLAEKELGYNPRPINETVSDTIEWFRLNRMIS